MICLGILKYLKIGPNSIDVTEAATTDRAMVREYRIDVLFSWLDGYETVEVEADTSLSIAIDMAHADKRFDENFRDF